MPILISKVGTGGGGGGGPIEVIISKDDDSIEVFQDTHDNLNANANIQVGNVDVGSGNPIPVSDEETHDILNGFFAAPKEANAVVITYTDATKANIDTVVFKTGGIAGTTVMTLTATYPSATVETYERS